MLRRYGDEVIECFDHNDRIPQMSRLRLAINTIWSYDSHKRVSRVIEREHPEITHFHNTFPLISPSAYYACKAAGVPVVQTLHNYRPLCPNAVLHRDNRPCEDCVSRLVPWPSLLHSCYRDDRAATGVIVGMLCVHRLLKTWSRMIDLFIAITEFGRQKFIAGGFPAERIVVKPNFVDPDPGVGTHLGGFALYAGRLSPEKGIDTLLSAWEKLGPRIPLKILGTGPLEGKVQEHIRRLPGVEHLSHRSLTAVYEVMKDAYVLVFPSTQYETFGRVAVEAFATGLPVIASRRGTMAELIDHGRTGLLFDPGNADDLADTVQYLFAHREEATHMRIMARQEYLQKYTAAANYENLMGIYRLAKSLSSTRKR